MKKVLVKNTGTNPVSLGTVTVASGEEKEVPANMVGGWLKKVKTETVAAKKKRLAEEAKAVKEKKEAAEKEAAEKEAAEKAKDK